MKTKHLLFIIAVGIMAGMFFLNPSQDQNKQYKPREIVKQEQGFAGSAKWIYERKADKATGIINVEDVKRAQNEVAAFNKKSSTKSTSIDWTELGPDNVGGRTRAILIDKDNPNVVYAGGVSGGLWRSSNGGQTWNLVETADGSLFENVAVVSICQSADGTIYFGTGEDDFYYADGIGTGGINGQGIWKSSNEDNTEFERLESTWGTSEAKSIFVSVSRMAADPTNASRIYAATKKGLRVSNDAGLTWTNPVNGASNTAAGLDVKVSTEGYVIYSSKSRSWISDNGNDGTFVSCQPVTSSVRLEYAFAPSDGNYIYCQATNSAGGLFNIYRSTDRAVNWEIVGYGGSDLFNPLGKQGEYDNVLAVFPDNKNKVIAGGQASLWYGTESNNEFGWEAITMWYLDPLNSKYVHADQHTIVFHPNYKSESNPEGNEIFYVGSDGGVSQTIDGGDNFHTMNKKYNTIQFYSVACSGGSRVIGGAQDNGTLFLYQEGNTTQNAIEIEGGDGGHAEYSELNPNLFFATVYYGSLTRSKTLNQEDDMFEFYNNDIVNAYPTLGEDASAASFITPIRLWESYNDEYSIDSVQYYNDSIFFMLESHMDSLYVANVIESYKTGINAVTADTFAVSGIEYLNIKITYGAGDVIVAESNIYERPLPFELTEVLTVGDSVKVQDVYQSALAVGFNDGVWITRKAHDFNLADTMDYWFRVSNPDSITIYTVSNIEWSKDGNYLYYSDNTNLYRSSNILDARTDDEMNALSENCVIETELVGSFSQKITGISVDPSDPDNVVVTLGSFSSSSHIYYSSNATSTSPTFSSRQGDLPSMPVYSALVIWDNSGACLVGTEYGVYSTDNISSTNPTWTVQNNNGMSNVPVYMLRQQTHENIWGHNVYNHGHIYAATHGRGIFKTSSFAGPVAIEERPTVENKPTIQGINVYPNPSVDIANVNYTLNSKSDVQIKVYNLQGSLIINENIKNQYQGTHNYSIDANRLEAGTYIISVSAGNKRNTSKLVVY